MTNDRLRSCIAAAKLTIAEVAERVGVDRKTADRWISTGRVPHPRHRAEVAALLRTEETYLWPELLDDSRVKTTTEAEFAGFYPSRGAVPANLWHSLFEGAAHHIDILVYSGLFLPDGYPQVGQILVQKAGDGVAVRVLLGDPECDAVQLRGQEEGIGAGMAARIRLSMTYLRPAIEASGPEVRLHSTTLYNSIYRFDADMLVNTHVYGAPAAHSPVLHLRQLAAGRLFSHFAAAFDRVWAQARPATAE